MSKIFLASILLISINLTLQSLEDDIAYKINNTAGEKTLSRKRRYLVFPEGSSLQLVYCLTIPSIAVGEIFSIGSTAALAWELPHEPFWKLKKDALNGDKSEKRKDQIKTSWTNKKTISFQDFQKYKQSLSNAYNNYIQYNRPVMTYANPMYHQIHRRTRRDLYVKLEKFFSIVSKNGRECLLKYICEVSQTTAKKGTFMEEIIKAIFRVRHEEDNEEKDEYDKAANKEHNCTEIYPGCNATVWNGLF